MTTYYVRMLDAVTGGEGSYQFEGPTDLMQRTADEVVSHFFEHMEPEVLKQHVDWEINGVFKNKERHVVAAIGSLIPGKDESPQPFLLLVADHNA